MKSETADKSEDTGGSSETFTPFQNVYDSSSTWVVFIGCGEWENQPRNYSVSLSNWVFESVQCTLPERKQSKLKIVR